MRIYIEGMDELTKRLKVKTPLAVERMAYKVVAETAAIGRREEQRSSTSLALGVSQHSVRKGKVVERVNLRRSPRAGWVSTSRSDAKGQPFRMASFDWERARPNVKRAGYTNLLANLWHRPSKPYRWDSPEVGQTENPKGLMHWRKGQRRPVKYNWSRTRAILELNMPKAVAVARTQFREEMRQP